MIPRKFRVCEVFGIPLYLDFSLAFLLVLYATGGSGLWFGLLGAAMLLVSITLHELGHALTARAFGYETSDITLSLLGGCASLIALPRKAWQELATAVAGPATSFALSFLSIVGVWLCAARGGLDDALFFVVGEVLESFGLGSPLDGQLFVSQGLMWLVGLLIHLAVMNAVLGLFNLLPGFPMDGGRVFRSALRAFVDRTRATYCAMIVGRVVAVLLALSGAYRLLSGGSWGVVTLLIALMIWREGGREYRQALVESAWDGKWNFSARVSPPPYGGRSGKAEVHRNPSR